MAHNLDELVAPEWLNRKYFEKILQGYENDTQLTVSSADITPASKVGEHFASIMFRVKIVYQTNNGLKEQKKSIIVKTKPFLSGLKKDMLENSTIFDVEMKMYTKIVPEMHRLLRLIGDQTTQFGPRLVYCSKKPTDVLIFEDLCEQNYMLSIDPLEFDATKMVLEQIGKWHACSMYMKADFNDEFLESYNKNIFNEGLGGKEVIVMLQTNFKIAMKLMQKWPGFEKHISKFSDMIKNMQEIGKDTYLPNKEGMGYNVLNHSDLHLKNMMFQKNENGVIDNVKLLDFQIPSYASPAIDVYYALFVVAGENCREHRDELIYLYYDIFADTLKKIGYLGKIPTMVDLQIELLKHGFMQVMLVTGWLPLFYYDFTKMESFEDMFNPDNDNINQMKEEVYSQPEVTAILHKYLLESIRLGYF